MPDGVRRRAGTAAEETDPEAHLARLFDELCQRDPPCVVDASQMLSLMRLCGVEATEEEVQAVIKRAVAESRQSAVREEGRGDGAGAHVDGDASLPAVLVDYDQFRRVLAHWPSVDLTHINVESLWVQCRQHADSPLAPHLPRTLWQLALPKMLLSFLAGGLAGAIAKSAIAPFDRMKIMFQSSDLQYSTRNAVQLVKDIVRSEGAIALFKGNTATVFRILPYSGVQLMSYDQFKMAILRRRHGKPGDRLSAPEKICAGACAGASSVLVTYPLDLVRARLAVQRKDSRYKGVVHAFRTAVKDEGVLSLYRGLTPSLLGILPYAGFAFATFETLKQISRDRTGRAPTGMERLVFGGIAGLVGQCFVYPLDVARRRLQTAGFVEGGEATPRGLLPVLRHVHKTEGFRGLFKGMSLNFIKGPLAVGISFTVFDLLKHQWGVDKIRASES